MHVLISVVFAVLMQTPGVHINAIDAAVSVEQASTSHDAADPRACPCRLHRHAR
ncbi:MAG: hypothetical protein ACXU8S_09110 [Phenylobacterium sp.]